MCVLVQTGNTNKPTGSGIYHREFVMIHMYDQEYIIEGRESILLHYSTVYQPFTGVSDLTSVLWFHGLHGNHCGSACVQSSCTCSCFVYSHVLSS